MFQAGVDKKLIREISGHRSDATDKYSETSHAQRRHISNILAGTDSGNVAKDESSKVKSIEVEKKSDASSTQSQKHSCNCHKKVVKTSETSQIGSMISDIVNARKGSKTTVRIEIEFSD